MDSKEMINYAQEDNAAEFRNALHSAIQSKIANHIEFMKQNIAQNMFNQPEEEV